MLVRRCVAKRLGDYFAQPANRVVGRVKLSDEINFKSLWGEWHWRRLVARFYREQDGRWLTSVELMRPHYSNAIANFVAAQVQIIQDDKDASPIIGQQQSPVDIVEMGGGRGTNAELILSHLRKAYPSVYEQIQSYTLIDASPSLLEFQQETLRRGDHFDKMKFELKDLIDIAEEKRTFLTPSDNPTVVIGCELLDNLPHDKVRVRAGRLLEQAEVIHDNTRRGEHSNNCEREKFVKLSDPILTSILRTVPAYTRTSPVAWVPSVACGVLQRLHRDRPNASVMLVDFDWLPDPDLRNDNGKSQERRSVWAMGEPIVTDMQGVDHECYLQAPPQCDILFPTDFPKLAYFARQVWDNTEKPRMRSSRREDCDDDKLSNAKFQVDVLKQSDFLELYGPEQVVATKSLLTGFTPLLHDFGNCSVLTVTRLRDKYREADAEETESKSI